MRKLRWNAFETQNPDTTKQFENLCLDWFIHAFLTEITPIHANPNQTGVEIEPVWSDVLQKRISYQSKYFTSGNNMYTEIEKSLKKVPVAYGGKLDCVYLLSNKQLDNQAVAYQRVSKLLQDNDIELIMICGDILLNKIEILPEGIIEKYWGKDYAKESYEILKGISDTTHTDEPSLYSNSTTNNDPVIGRENQLSCIHQKFAEQGEMGTSRIIFLRGMGGIGKSVLAKKYAELNQESYETIIEVSADSFRGVINAIPIRNWSGSGLDEETKYNVRFQLIKDLFNKQKVLLIVHDYNTADDVEARWRELPCDMLITTWNEWKGLGFEIRLRESDIAEKDAVSIFAYYYLDSCEYQGELNQYLADDEKAVMELAKAVDYHPLSIKVLAKQMVCEADDLIRPKQMLEQLSFSDEKEFLNLHESGEGSNPENTSAHKHMEKVFIAALKRGKLDNEQLEALRYMTLVSPVCGISSGRFSTWTGLDRKLLIQLEKRGWIEYYRTGKDALDDSKDSVGIYKMPMVIGEILYQAEILRSTPENSERFLDKWSNTDIDQCIGYEKRNALMHQSISIADHINSCEISVYARILSETGQILYENSEIRRGQKYCKKALEIRLRVLGEDHVGTVQSYSHVGYGCALLGDYKESLEYREKALEICRHSLGEDHAYTAHCYHNVGRSYELQGDHKKCLEYLEKALEIRLRVLGDDHVDTATSYNDLGYNYESQGNYKKGLEYLEKALEIYRRTLGENHANTAQCYSNVGRSYEWQGDYKKGLEYKEKALDIRLRVLGEEQLDTAESYNNVGLSYEYWGDYEKGLEYKKKALEIYRKILGENHAFTARCYSNLGRSYEYQGDYKKGLEYKEKALQIYRNTLGEDHAYTAQSYSIVGESYEFQGNHKKSLDYLEKALEIRLRVLGENHLETTMSYNAMGYHYESKGDYKKSLEYYEKALNIRLRVLGEDSMYIAQNYCYLGYSYELQGNCQKSLEYHEKALNIYRNVLGEDNAYTALSYYTVGYNYEILGDCKKSMEYHEKALDIRIRVLGEDNIETALSYNELGWIYMTQGDYKKGMEYLEKALEIRIRFLGEDNTYTALSYATVGYSYASKGEHRKGLDYLKKALEIYRNVLGEEHAYTADVYYFVGKSYLHLKKFKNAYDNLNSAEKIYKKLSAEGNLQIRQFEYSRIFMSCLRLLGLFSK